MSTLSRYGALREFLLKPSVLPFVSVSYLQVFLRQPFDNSYLNEPECKSHNGLIVSMITKDDFFLKDMVYSLGILYQMISLDP